MDGSHVGFQQVLDCHPLKILGDLIGQARPIVAWWRVVHPGVYIPLAQLTLLRLAITPSSPKELTRCVTITRLSVGHPSTSRADCPNLHTIHKPILRKKTCDRFQVDKNKNK